MAETSKMIRMHEIDKNKNKIPMVPVTNARAVNIDSTNVPEGVTNLEDLVDNLGELAFADEITIPQADTSGTVGLTKLSNVTDDTTDESSAATTAAVSLVANNVKTVSEEAVKKTGDEDVNGMKSFTEGAVIANTKITSEVSTDGVFIVHVAPVNPITTGTTE